MVASSYQSLNISEINPNLNNYQRSKHIQTEISQSCSCCFMNCSLGITQASQQFFQRRDVSERQAIATLKKFSLRDGLEGIDVQHFAPRFLKALCSDPVFVWQRAVGVKSLQSFSVPHCVGMIAKLHSFAPTHLSLVFFVNLGTIMFSFLRALICRTKLARHLDFLRRWVPWARVVLILQVDETRQNSM